MIADIDQETLWRSRTLPLRAQEIETWGGGEPQHRQLGCPVPWVGGTRREGPLHKGPSAAAAAAK